MSINPALLHYFPEPNDASPFVPDEYLIELEANFNHRRDPGLSLHEGQLTEFAGADFDTELQAAEEPQDYSIEVGIFGQAVAHQESHLGVALRSRVSFGNDAPSTALGESYTLPNTTMSQDICRLADFDVLPSQSLDWGVNLVDLEQNIFEVAQQKSLPTSPPTFLSEAVVAHRHPERRLTANAPFYETNHTATSVPPWRHTDDIAPRPKHVAFHVFSTTGQAVEVRKRKAYTKERRREVNAVRKITACQRCRDARRAVSSIQSNTT